MTCKRAMHNLLKLDNHCEPGTATRAHLEQCPRCRAEHQRLIRALRVLRTATAEEAAAQLNPALTDAIMNAVRAARCSTPARRTNHAHVRGFTPLESAEWGEPADWADYGRWIGSGLLILFGMVVLPSTELLTPLRTITGANVDAVLAITFGLVMSVYMALFVGTHIDDLRRRIRRIGPRP